MRTIPFVESSQETWRDGAPMVCSVCGQPILKGQPRYSTISHSPRKREVHHYLCQGGIVTVIGSPSLGIMEITQYGKQ